MEKFGSSLANDIFLLVRQFFSIEIIGENNLFEKKKENPIDVEKKSTLTKESALI